MRRWSFVILVSGIILVLGLGIVLTIVVACQPEASFPPGSAAATVATYLRLVQHGQADEAFALTDFTRPVGNSNVPVPQTQFYQWANHWSQQAHRVLLVRSSEHDGHASVVVEVTAFSPDLLAADQGTRQTFTLERRNGVWKITSPLFLYP
ncbi:MAG: hypothetical protein M1396_01325 [Chloroflexi bacterium]|nr:hypothetical protein [Chloroflexota bacterium]